MVHVLWIAFFGIAKRWRCESGRAIFENVPTSIYLLRGAFFTIRRAPRSPRAIADILSYHNNKPQKCHKHKPTILLAKIGSLISLSSHPV